MMKLLIAKIGGVVFAVLSMLSVFLWRNNKHLAKKNEELNLKSKDQANTIEIQNKVIDVVKQTKAVDFDSNIKRMQDGEL